MSKQYSPKSSKVTHKNNHGMNNLEMTSYLKTLPTDGSVYYCPDLGNAGDSLIAQATLQLFEEVGVIYNFVHWKQLDSFSPQGKTLIYGGGGNLVGYYKVARNIISKYHRNLSRMIVFPHTISGNEDILTELGGNVDIILRERVSYEHVRKNNSRSNIMLMDDLAFSLDVESLLHGKPMNFVIALALKGVNKLIPGKFTQPIPPLSHMVSNNFLELKCYFRELGKKQGGKVLNCFRTDVEQSGIDLPPDNLDLSNIFAYGTRNEVLIRYASYRLLKFMNKYDEIRTNRLHLCIAGALLGKRVKFYPNSYWKCEAIYDYSIKGRYDNVEWSTA